MEQPKLRPGRWIDDLLEPLETEADVEYLFAGVDNPKATRLEAAILRASKN
jgi:hypothetical protein